MGGLGVRTAKDLSLPAYISSSLASVDLVSRIVPNLDPSPDINLDNAIKLWIDNTGAEVPSGRAINLQRSWDIPATRKRLDDLINHPNNTERDLARLKDVCVKESGHFLEALPSTTLDNRLTNESLKVVTAYRLGIPIFTNVGPRTCSRCKNLMDAEGCHGLWCLRSAGRWDRHLKGNINLQKALISAGFPSRREPQGLCRTDRP
jgi:hypothetical protein